MRITSLEITNYRTLESIVLRFPSAYSAICGANDSGKTNVVRAIRSLVRGEGRSARVRFSDEEGLSLKDDYPKWKGDDGAARTIKFRIALSVDANRDTGLAQFIVQQLSLKSTADNLDLLIDAEYHPGKKDPYVTVTIGGAQHADLKAQQVLQKLQSSRSIVFHNSTEIETRYIFPGGSVAGHIREISGQHESLVASMRKTVNRGLARISRAQQEELEGLLGRLQTKYKVGLSMPSFDFDYLPFSITLGDAKVEVPLDDWGSGTRNRTLVLLALFRAMEMAKSDASASKITPVIIIEEPESFLHPSAQAEFGRVLQDLAEEFQVQVLVTTHSPYLLNLRDPAANILLERSTSYKQLRATRVVDTSGDNWMSPFGQALGLGADVFKPWKAMMLGGADAILLVEGPIDKEYFELLRDDKHGDNRLLLQGDIVPYEGTGALSNSVLLRFVKNRHARMFVTFDMDCASQIEKTLVGLQMTKGEHYWPIGASGAGKRNIEGLLPEGTTRAVYNDNPDLVQAATSGTQEEQRSAKSKLKQLLLEHFKANAKPGSDFSAFYAVVKVINKALRCDPKPPKAPQHATKRAGRKKNLRAPDRGHRV